MRVLSIVGSPRKKGNSATLAQEVCKAAESQGHKTETVFLYDLDIKGCLACMACHAGKVKICVHKDDFTKLAEKIIKADCLIVSSPIYMGQISGPLKTFFDRWCTFINKDFSIRHVSGKKFVTITTSGAPAKTYSGATDYLTHWMSEFFKLDHCGSLIGGNLFAPGEVVDKKKLMKEAATLGKTLE